MRFAMRARRLWFGFVGTLALSSLPARVGAQAVGPEFQVNTYTTSLQKDPSVAADASGNFVVVWFSNPQDGGSGGIFGQRYDSEGVAQGGEFQINSYTTSNQYRPRVASDASGNFVVVWDGTGQGDNFGIFGQRYDSGGAALGSEFRVNSYTTRNHFAPSIAADANGNFVVVWTGYQDGSRLGVFGQRFDSGGAAQGSEFQINFYTTNDQGGASVAAAPDGDFVVVWTNMLSYGDYDISGQRYNSEGVAQGGEFRVNSYTTFNQAAPSVATDASGNFVVVWASNMGQDGHRAGVFGQRFDSEGVAQGHEFRVNSYTTDDQADASVAYDASGNVVVVWASDTQDGNGWGVFGQRYDSGGGAQGGEFQINSHSGGTQWTPAVGATGPDQFVVAWNSIGQDGDGQGIFGQRFDFGGGTITVVSPNTNVTWRIGSQKEIRWTHNLGIDAIFRIKLDRNDDGEYEELIAAAAPANSATSGSFTWTITGPPSRTVRVRVAWTDDPAVSDSSDVTLQIKPPRARR
jgi:hypothetical protein